MTVKPMTHPTAEVLAAYGLGKLNESDIATVTQHLAVCPECRLAVEKVSPDSFIGRVRAAGPASSGTQLPMTVPHVPLASDRADPATATVPELPQELANHPKFRILKELGRGGMGVVYKAENCFMEMTVALKVISKSLLDNAEALERFDREVRAAARLVHPNIVRALDADRAGELRLLVMEFVEGASLFDVLKKKGPLPIPYACHYARQAALGLQHAHEQGMVHRDIKPHNLMLTPKGQVKILDFGLARLASEQKRAGGLTRSGDFMGTPDFVAPEQAMDASKADIRADIYSLGCTLYCLLTGHPPFQEDTIVRLVLAQIEKEPAPLIEVRPEVPSELSKLVGRMLAKDPAQRLRTPGEVAEALTPLCKAGQKAAAQPLKASPEGAALPADRTVLPGVPGRVKGLDKDTAKLIPTGEAAVTAGEKQSPFAGLAGEPTPPPKKEKKGRRAPKPRSAWWKRSPVLASAGGAVLVLALLAGIIIKMKVVTPDGNAYVVLEIDQAGAEVRVDGEKMTVNVPGHNQPVEIKVEPGQRQLRISKDGFEVVTKEIELKIGKSDPIKVQLKPVEVPEKKPPPLPIVQQQSPPIVQQQSQPPAREKPIEPMVNPAAPSNPKPTVSPSSSGPSRTAMFQIPIDVEEPVYGDWEIKNNELSQPKWVWGARLLFGDKKWADYDFTVQAQMADGNCGFGLLVRNCGVTLQRMQQDSTIRHKDQILFTVGAFGNTSHALEQVLDAKQQLLAKTPLLPPNRLKKGEWYTALVSVRGDRIQCYLNGNKLFEANTKVPPTGLAGLMTWNAPFRFRNIKVTDPAGKVLIEGLPDLDTWQSKIKKPDQQSPMASFLPQPGTVSPLPPRDWWKQLFNQKDLQSAHPGQRLKPRFVVDGVLEINTRGSVLTRKVYTNLKLFLEFQVSPDTAASIDLCSYPGDTPVWVFLENTRNAMGAITYDGNKKGFAVRRLNPPARLRPDEQWNDLTVDLNDGKVSVALNGRILDTVDIRTHMDRRRNTSPLVDRLKGHIGLNKRWGSGKINIRNLSIEELP